MSLGTRRLALLAGLATSKDCDARVNPRGYDSLIGTVSGNEPASASDDETVYTGTLRRATRGDCYQAEMDEIRADYPSGQSGASPSGQEINEVDPPKLFVNGMARLRPGYFPRDPVQGGWALRVVRALP